MSGEAMKVLAPYSDMAWALLLLERDPLHRYIDPQQREEIVHRAWQCANEQADLWLNEYPDSSFCQWFAQSPVDVTFSDKGQKPPGVLFATYASNPERIVLYRHAIDSVCTAMEIGDSQTVTNWLLAHEYYHRLEHTQPRPEFTYLLAYQIGRWKRKGMLWQYGEIAAAAFVKRTCSLNFYPAMLDAVLLSNYDSSYIGLFERRLKAIDAACGQAACANGDPR